MARDNPLMMFARHVATDLAAGAPGQGVALAFAMLERIPGAVEQLVDLIVAESRRKKPDGDVIEALALMLGQALETLRLDGEGGHADARTRVEALRARLTRLAERDEVGAAALMLLARQFTVAGLDPGDRLRSLLAERIGASASPEERADGGNPLEPLLALAEETEDEFALFALLQEMTGALPEEHRAMLAAAGFAPTAGATTNPAPGLDRLRAATVGWLFDPAASVRKAAAAVLGAAVGQGLLSGTMLRRLVTLRNWLPEEERAAIDAVVADARRKGVALVPQAVAQVREVFATGWDGAGAQSLFIVAKEGRRFAVAALLLKQGGGVRDAWVQHGGTRRDVDALLGNVEDQVGMVGSTIDYAVAAAAHALGLNAVAGSLPPFGLLDVVETTGLADLRPQTVAVDALVAMLCEALPAGLLASQAEAMALRASATWAQRHPFTQSWFEGADTVAPLLTPPPGRKRLPKAKAADLVLDRVLEGRRGVWAERIAWTAAALRSPEPGGKKAGAGNPGSPDWVDFALVARALLEDRPLRDLPVMVAIARLTVEAFAMDGRY